MYADNDEQKPKQNLNDIVLTPLSPTAPAPDPLCLSRPSKTSTREMYLKFNDAEGRACQNNGGMRFVQDGAEFCMKPYCKCTFQQEYKPDSNKKTCGYKTR